MAQIIHTFKHIPHRPELLYRGISLYLVIPNLDYFLFQSFMSTTQKLQIAIKFASGDNNERTIFKIISFTGKPIAKYSNYQSEEQFVFLPFSVFFPTKQNEVNSEPKLKYELVELSGPIKYCSKMLLWIGNPDQLSQHIRSQEEVFGFEFLYIPTLFIFKRWQIEYGWLLKWKETKVKILINQRAMLKEKVQYLYQQNPLNNENDDSRILFLLLLYGQWGFKSNTLIYCDDPLTCKKRALLQKVDQKCQFTDSLDAIERFIEFD